MHSTHLLALAIDMPLMTPEYLTSLCSRIRPCRGVITKIDERLEPLAAIYPREALTSIRSALSGEDFSLQTLTGRLVASRKLDVVFVTSQKKLFLNVNEPSDLAVL
jgi:molybdopterin-guanine dinucleotide biosynthesis protein A